jgi:hypothetical protein
MQCFKDGVIFMNSGVTGMDKCSPSPFSSPLKGEETIRIPNLNSFEHCNLDIGAYLVFRI